jgi:hypothetical protein
MDSAGKPTPCLPLPCPKNTLGLACSADEIKNCKAIPGAHARTQSRIPFAPAIVGGAPCNAGAGGQAVACLP